MINSIWNTQKGQKIVTQTASDFERSRDELCNRISYKSFLPPPSLCWCLCVGKSDTDKLTSRRRTKICLELNFVHCKFPIKPESCDPDSDTVLSTPNLTPCHTINSTYSRCQHTQPGRRPRLRGPDAIDDARNQ